MIGWVFEALFDALWLTAAVIVMGILLCFLALIWALFITAYPGPGGQLLGGLVVMFLVFFFSTLSFEAST